MEKIFKDTKLGKIDTWDIQFLYSCWKNNGLGILPTKNLVTNIGFDSTATHTTSSDPIMNNLRAEEITFPLIHPQKIVRDIENDRWVDKNVFRINFKTALYFITITRPIIIFLKKVKNIILF